MTARVISPTAWRQVSAIGFTTTLAVLVVACSFALGVMAQEPARVRLAVAGAASVAVVALADRSPRHLLYGVVVWLTFLGFVRRIVGEVGPSSRADPILLVSPFALGLLLLLLVWRRRLGLTSLGKSVLALQVLIVLGALNPLQGNIAGGIAGLLFVLVPTFGFWIGRHLCDDRTLRGLLRIIAGLAIVVALYGLSQTLLHFTSWDRQWIDSVGQGSLVVNGTIRPFGTLSSAAEYGTFLAVGLVVWIAYLLRFVLLPVAVAVIALLGVAIFLESSRGLVVVTVATIGVVLGARARLPGAAAVGLAAGLVLVLSIVVKHVGVPGEQATGTSGLVSHQLTGLSNPLDPNVSTATTHYKLMLSGLRAGFHNPIGQGTGVITIAGQRFGGVTAGTEVDVSNVAVALGIPGLLAYLLVVVMGFRRLYSRVRHRGDRLSVAALGIATVTSMQWLNGGQYAVAILPWLMLGWADRPDTETVAATHSPVREGGG